MEGFTRIAAAAILAGGLGWAGLASGALPAGASGTAGNAGSPGVENLHSGAHSGPLQVAARTIHRNRFRMHSSHRGRRRAAGVAPSPAPRRAPVRTNRTGNRSRRWSAIQARISRARASRRRGASVPR